MVVEAELKASRELLEQSAAEVDNNTMQAEIGAAVDMLSDVQSLLDEMESSSAESRARNILRGLGFSEEASDGSYNRLSGGWQTRCTLACALFQKVDLLLLDECTNFLDLPAIVWLQSYVVGITDSTVLIVTHDRDFADAVADELVLLREHSLETFRGNLSAYEIEQRKYRQYMTTMKEAQNKKTKLMEASIASNYASAKKTGDDKKLKQVVSRRKKLEERTGLEVNAKGGRFKLNRDRAGFQDSLRAEIEIPKMDSLVQIKIPNTPSDLRHPGALVSLENLTCKYPRSKVATLKDVTLVLHPGERAGIAGLNGAGKSTLVKCIAGADVQLVAGTIVRHPRAKIKTFSQHAVETLERKGIENPTLSPLEELLSTAEGALIEQEARGLLSGLGLSGRTVSDVSVAALSGGQKVRLELARLLYEPPHLLILDEVTTHLDADTVTAMIEALKGYQGALLVVTHDIFFMRSMVEGEPLDRDHDEDEDYVEGTEYSSKPGVVYRLFKGQLKLLQGGMQQYEGIAERASRKLLAV